MGKDNDFTPELDHEDMERIKFLYEFFNTNFEGKHYSKNWILGNALARLEMSVLQCMDTLINREMHVHYLVAARKAVKDDKLGLSEKQKKLFLERSKILIEETKRKRAVVMSKPPDSMIH